MPFFKRRSPRGGWERSAQPFPFDEHESFDEYEKRRAEVDTQHSKDLVTKPAAVHDLADWDGDLAERRIQIRTSALNVEIFGTPSSAKDLYVFLSAGGGAIKDGITPQFPRVSWHPWMDGVSLNIDDPTFAAYPGKLQTGWYLGSPEQDGIATTATIIEKVRGRYGIRPESIYIIGSSAGGTAALQLAAVVSGATAIAENPPIYPAESSSARHLARVGLRVNSGAFAKRIDARQIFHHDASRFLILQNVADKVFIEQLARFLRFSGMSEPAIGLNEAAPLSIYLTSVPSLSPHHAFLSVHELRSVIDILKSPATLDTRAAVLNAIHESLRARILSGDQLSNTKGWARLLPELRVPQLADLPEPSANDVIRVRLREYPEAIYRIRMGHQAKKVFIAVNVKKTNPVSKTEIEAAATAVGATVSNLDGGYRIGISGVPTGKAAEKVKQFVEATAVLFGR